jgi:phospholipid-binding lipoprotein MlaA
MPVDYVFDPRTWYSNGHDFRYEAQRLPTWFYLVTLRSRGIDAEGLLEGVYDPYVFYRDAYRQRRLYDIYDGQPPAEVIEQMQGTGDVDVDQLLDEQRAYEKKNGDK